MDITISASDVKIEPGRGGKVSVALSDISVADLIKQVGQDEILDAIGRNDCLDYFGVEDVDGDAADD